jgi:hypothetical protein
MLPFEYAAGIDIRFKQDAVVVIVAKELPEPEMVWQMACRGTRSLGTIESIVFTQGEPS